MRPISVSGSAMASLAAPPRTEFSTTLLALRSQDSVPIQDLLGNGHIGVINLTFWINVKPASKGGFLGLGIEHGLTSRAARDVRRDRRLFRRRQLMRQPVS